MSVVVVETLPTRVDRAVRRAASHYRAAVGNHRGWDVRRSSTVSHRVARPTAAVLGRLCAAGELVVDVGDVRLVAEPSSSVYDRIEHEHRLRAALHLAWSWPALPVWLAVAEDTAGSCRLRLSLRSRHRLRYPVRYFDAAHRVLDQVADLG